MRKKIAKTTRIKSGIKPGSNRVQASSAGIPITTRELIEERDRIITTQYVPFFKDSNNIYINDLARRARRSSTHSAILDAKRSYTVGNSFSFDRDLTDSEQAWIDSVNASGESLRKVFTKVCGDYIDFGNAWIQVVIVGDRVNYYHTDATTVRVSKDKKIAIISNYWREIGNGSHTSSAYPSIEISMDANKPTKLDGGGKAYMIQWKREEAEFNYYGLPDYIAALNWIDVEYRIPKYNLDRFDNGFFPSALIQLFGTPPDGISAQKYVKEFVNRFTGEAKNSKVVAELLDSPEQAANVHTFDSEKQGEFEKLAAMAKVNIISAHRIPPVLAMIETAGKLGSNQQVTESHNLFMNTVAIPEYQNPALELFNKLIRLAGFGFVIGINQLSSLTLVGAINPSDVLTVNEQRELLGYEPIEEDQKSEENGG